MQPAEAMATEMWIQALVYPLLRPSWKCTEEKSGWRVKLAEGASSLYPSCGGAATVGHLILPLDGEETAWHSGFSSSTTREAVEAIQDRLEAYGFTVTTAGRGLEALKNFP